jgi:hypothetical protein
MLDRLLKAAKSHDAAVKGSDTASASPAQASLASGSSREREAQAGRSRPLPSLQAVLQAAEMRERHALIDAWIEAGADTKDLKRALETLQQKDKGAAKRIRQELQVRKAAIDEGDRERQLLSQAQSLLEKPDLRAQDLAALEQKAVGIKSTTFDELCGRLRQRLAAQTLLQQQLRDWHALGRQWQASLQRCYQAPLVEARAAWKDLRERRETVLAEAERFAADAEWSAMPVKVQAAVQAHRGEIQADWQRFEAELALAVAADEDVQAPLPSIPAWATELEASRHAESNLAERQRVQALEATQARSRAQHQAAIDRVMERLAAAEKALEDGHVREAQKVLDAIRSEGVRLPDALVERINNARSGIYDLLAWQRWRADQIRTELCEQAEALAQQPLPVREQGEAVRELRERWKLLAREGEPTAALWPRFDAACTRAYEPVAAHIEQERAQFEAVERQREDLIRQLAELGRTIPADDLRGLASAIDRLGARWRTAGALPDGRAHRLQRVWDTTLAKVAAPLEAARAESVSRREGMIAEVERLVAEGRPGLFEAIREIQSRWQRESQRVMLPRRQEQQLWQRFRAPIEAWHSAREQARQARQQNYDAARRQFSDALAGKDRPSMREAIDRLDAAADAWAAAERGLPPALQREMREAHDALHRRLRDLDAESRLGAVDVLLDAWRDRSLDKVGDRKSFALSLGPKFKAALDAWLQAVCSPAKHSGERAQEALLRLEILCDLPSPAELQPARRLMQLKILAERSRPVLEAQWGREVEAVLGAAFEDAAARRLVTVLRKLLS